MKGRCSTLGSFVRYSSVYLAVSVAAPLSYSRVTFCNLKNHHFFKFIVIYSIIFKNYT